MGQNCAEKILIFCLIFILPVCFIVHPGNGSRNGNLHYYL